MTNVAYVKLSLFRKCCRRHFIVKSMKEINVVCNYHSTEGKQEHQDLTQALIAVREILNQIDAQVAEKELEIRLLEIYNKIDAKSNAYFRERKFKKSDLLSSNRKLRHEGVISWKRFVPFYLFRHFV